MIDSCVVFLVTTDAMDILHAKRYKQQHRMRDIVKPQPVVGNKQKHPTLLRGKKKTRFDDIVLFDDSNMKSTHARLRS
jgi:hypothetical protein